MNPHPEALVDIISRMIQQFHCYISEGLLRHVEVVVLQLYIRLVKCIECIYELKSKRATSTWSPLISDANELRNHRAHFSVTCTFIQMYQVCFDQNSVEISFNECTAYFRLS